MIHIRIGTKEDKCRSCYGILYDEDGDLFRSDATSFWVGILDGPTNIKGHTKSEVMNSYQSRVLDANAEYKPVCNIKLEPFSSPSYFDVARKITTFLQKGRNQGSSPERVLTGLPKFLMKMGHVEILCEDGKEPHPVPHRDMDELVRKIPSLSWAF
ncbi:hypothetical protein [Acidithiobacillus albertensis]|uniref:hypothetical protein n=1 Tax=Acidithiobacillus albertensis TaxID=119978 RepID=UPI001C078880|nr:hypothetical protein [Acidithiobacillus albertensis]MBU2741724.1 hypothetical protein [Acidithiobacillus albertensis]